MKGFGLSALSALLTGAIGIIATEVYATIKAKASTADPAKAWTIADKWLSAHYPIADWAFRIVTVVFLAYVTYRVAVSVP